MHPATILPFFSTLLGGFAALRLRHRLHALMAIAAGIVVATAVADLFPEAWELVGEGGALAMGTAAVVGFIGFSLLEAFIHQSSFEHAGTRGHVHAHGPHTHEPAHEHEDHDHDAAREAVLAAGSAARPGLLRLLPPTSLVVHSALDGLMIGVAFQAGDETGLIVLLAVLCHDFADGMNVATVALEAARGVRLAVVFVLLDGLAAPLGGAVSGLVSIDDRTLGLLLAGFGGVFLAIGAGHLLPESQHRDPSRGPVMVALAAGGAVVALAARAIAPA
ncbi:MAG TPA: ZIP family metal transporter [Candidatus Binatia bacterium]|nr:ZIP family metal transporter [Candidatus Binatia bacterium]